MSPPGRDARGRGTGESFSLPYFARRSRRRLTEAAVAAGCTAASER